MTYRRALKQEISSLPPALLPEAVDFVLFLKIKARMPGKRGISLMNISRGEIWKVNLDPTMGAEICKSRPVVVVSSDARKKYT